MKYRSLTFSRTSGFLQFAGYQYWTASLLPVLIGATLPFWLDPPGFHFKWVEAVLFLLATLLGHAGFALLHAFFVNQFSTPWPKFQSLRTGIAALTAVFLIGLFLNQRLELNQGVHDYIFVVYGLSTLFTGVLYVAPPFSFYRRLGGEVVFCVGLGMLPVLGAYLVQAGDLTRTVYVASLPVVLATALWRWISDLISRPDDQRSGYDKISLLFTYRFAGRYGTATLTMLMFSTLVLAVFGRSSLNPLSLTALLCAPLALKIVVTSWNHYDQTEEMRKARQAAFGLHASVCFLIVMSSLASVF